MKHSIKRIFGGLLVLLVACSAPVPPAHDAKETPKVLPSDTPSILPQAIVNSGLSLPWDQSEGTWIVSGPHGPTNGYDTPYIGIDFQRPGYNTHAVRAMADGQLTYSDNWCPGSVQIAHTNGLTTRYVHIKKNTRAAEGPVHRGDIIGYYGWPSETCGIGDTPHVHVDIIGANFNANSYDIGGWRFESTGTAYAGCITNLSLSSVPVGTRRCGQYLSMSIENENKIGSSDGGPPPPPPTFETRFLRTDTLALNFRIWTFRNYGWLWPSADGDPDQNFRMYAPGTYNGNAGWMIKRLDTNDCLNAYNPGNGSSVYGLACSSSDGDQQWELQYYTSIGKWLVKRQNSNYCLNAYAPATDSRVNLFSCDTGDGDQQWRLNSYPAPKWTPSTTAIVSSATVGQAPANQSFTIINEGMVAGGHLVGGPATYQLTQTGNWFGISPTSGDLSRGVDRGTASNDITVSYGACTTPGTQNGTITISGSGAEARTLNVSRTCSEAPKPAWTVNPSSLQFSGRVGETPVSKTFTIQNTGNAQGTFSLVSSDNAFVTASGYSTDLPANATTTVTVMVGACTAVGTTTGEFTVSGGASSQTVGITRTCDAALKPAWTVNPTSLQFSGRVGETPVSKTFTIQNTGNAQGTFSLVSSDNAFVTASGYTSSLPVNTSTTATVKVGACTTVGTTTGQLTASGGGAASQAVTITRTCDEAVPSAPATPAISSITMSSVGRMFIAWPEVANATRYDFLATFDGTPMTVTGEAPSSGGANGSAVAAFISAPDAANRQGKQVCFAIRARNAGGASAYSAFACTTYRYYAASVSVQSVGETPQLLLQ